MKGKNFFLPKTQSSGDQADVIHIQIRVQQGKQPSTKQNHSG